MVPTYLRGDWLLVRYLHPSSRPRVKVGQVLLIERIDQPGPILIKRLKDIRADSPNRHYPTYWVEGDNKEISQDSRKWGALDGEEIVGKALREFASREEVVLARGIEGIAEAVLIVDGTVIEDGAGGIEEEGVGGAGEAEGVDELEVIEVRYD